MAPLMVESHMHGRDIEAPCGLLLVKDMLKTPDDFGGHEVKARSLVGSSNITILSSPEPGRAACVARNGTKEWFDLRHGYLVKKEAQIRALHNEAVVALQSMMGAVRNKSDDVVQRGPHALFMFIDQLQRVHGHLNKVILPLATTRQSAPFFPHFFPPPEREDHSFDPELVEPWICKTQEVLAKVTKLLDSRVKMLTDIVEFHTSSAPASDEPTPDSSDSDSTTPGPEMDPAGMDPKSWSNNERGTLFVRKADTKACSELLDSIQFTFDAFDGKGYFNVSPVVTNLSEEGAVSCKVVMSASKMLMPDSWSMVCRTPLFKSGIDGAEIVHEIASKLRPLYFAPNSLVIKKGTVGLCMYFINSGSCKISVEGNVVARRRSGDFMGEIALIVSEERVADVETEEPAELFELRRSEFHEIVGRFPHVYKRLAAVATQRIKEGKLEETLDEEEKSKMMKEEDLKAVESDEAFQIHSRQLPQAKNPTFHKKEKSTLEEDHFQSGAVVEEIDEECTKEMLRQLLVSDDKNDADKRKQMTQIIAAVRQKSRRVVLPPNSEVVRKGDYGCYLYIIEKGSCMYQESSTNLAIGCIFGDVALVSSCTRESSVVTGREGAVVLQMARHDILNLLDTVPLFDNVLQVLAAKQLD